MVKRKICFGAEYSRWLSREDVLKREEKMAVVVQKVQYLCLWKRDLSLVEYLKREDTTSDDSKPESVFMSLFATLATI